MKEGYAVVPQLVEVSGLKAALQEGLAQCARDLDLTEREYLSVVSRWAHPSPPLTAVPKQLIEQISDAAGAMLGEPVELSKMNLICKNAYCRGSVPFHQDVAYSPENPYRLSTWVALDDVSEEGGCLEVVPGSHLGPIEPAVDFWSPHYQPERPPLAKKIAVSAGDAIFFDSRLWHGSGPNRGSERYALVLRWKVPGWTVSVPPRQSLFFGMWSCGEETRARLSAALEERTGEQQSDIIALLDRWVELSEGEPATQEALRAVKILHLANERHNGGDATGMIYRNLWNQLLSRLGVGVHEEECSHRGAQVTRCSV